MNAFATDTSTVKTGLRYLTVSIIATMAAQSSIAATNVNQMNSDFTAQSINLDGGSDDLPSTTLDKIVVIAEDLSNSENKKDYVFYRPSTSTGLTLTPKQTPQSVTTITDQQIKDQDLQTFDAVLESTPGISAANLDGGRIGFSARGFELDQYSIDGQKVFYTTGWLSGEDQVSTAIYDRAEVVRGASGLTSGSGNPSASVNLVRKRANSKVPTASFTINANEYETYGGSVDASTPLSADGSVRARFVAEYQEGDTYIDRENKERGVLYGVLDADIGQHTDVSLGVSYQKNEQNSTMWGALPAYYSDGSEAEWDVSKNASVDWVNWDSENLTYFGAMSHDLNNYWRLNLKASHSETEGDSRLFYLLGNVVDKQTGLGLKEYNGRYDLERNIDTVQASVDGYFDAFDYTQEVRFGASYNKNEETGFEYPAMPNFSPIGNFFEWDGSHPEPTWGDKNLLSDITIEEKSLFASGRFKLSDPLALILGTRVTNFEAEGINSGKPFKISHDDVWVPYVGATYDVNNNHTVFASYTSIFKPQQEKDANNDYLNPIEGDNYELGIKSNNDAETLQAQFSVFRIEQDNLAQETGQIIPNSNPPTAAYREAEGATSTGIDVEVTGKLTPEWQTSIGYTQFKAEDVQGKRVNSGFPDRLFKLFTTYDASNWINGLTLGAGINWSDDRYTTLTNPVTNLDEKRVQDDVALLNVMARYELNDNLALQLNVDNLFDEKYVDSVSFEQIYYGDPLTVSGKLTYEF